MHIFITHPLAKLIAQQEPTLPQVPMFAMTATPNVFLAKRPALTAHPALSQEPIKPIFITSNAYLVALMEPTLR